MFPIVRRELAGWTRRAEAIPDIELRKQALSSISSKAFHCMGGAVLALEDPRRASDLVKSIVAIQTVSDYLDNLCDRAKAISTWAEDSSVEAARAGFRTCMRLHEAFLCAVDSGRAALPYYVLYPVDHPLGDGGYLQSLVDTSRDITLRLPTYRVALPRVQQLAQLYSELQSIKHLAPEIRDGLMEEWFRVRWVGDLRPSESRLPLDDFPGANIGRRWPAERSKGVDQGSGQVSAHGCGHIDCSDSASPSLQWWEFAAATGSTLGIFALTCASGDPTFGPDQAEDLLNAYFPSISALHILLDYYIDQEEDRAGGDLNFVAHYASPHQRKEAMSRFATWAMDDARRSTYPWLHRAVVRGLLAMYLSDSKVGVIGLAEEARILAQGGGPMTDALRAACGVIRKHHRF